MKKENNEQKLIKTSVILGGIPFKVTSEGYEDETVGDETILYFSKLKKVLTLNATCTIIWSVLEKNVGSDMSISEDDFQVSIGEKYIISEEVQQKVISDIYKLFADLTHEGVLHMKMEGAASESKDLKGILLSSVSKDQSVTTRCSQSAVKSSIGCFTDVMHPISKSVIGTNAKQTYNSSNDQADDGQ